MGWGRVSAAATCATSAAAAAVWSLTKPSDPLSAAASTRQRSVLARATLRARTAGASAGLLSRNQVDSVISNVEASGICVVEDVLSAESRKYLDQVAAAAWQSRGQVVYGRVHSDLMDAPEREAIEQLCAGLLPLVGTFFRPNAGQPCSTNVGNDREGGQESSRRWYLSQLQFVDAMPGCSSQFWHCDNTARGLTILIPLVPTTATNGPTELFPSSHRVWQSGSSDRAQDSGEEQFDSMHGSPAAAAAAMNSLMSSIRSGPIQSVGPVRAMVAAGAAIIYDSRTLHRGRTNLTEARRPALVLRYDLRHTPPPGMGAVATSIVRLVGNIAERLCGMQEVAVHDAKC